MPVMYVCLCNGHTSQQLEALARSGVACVDHAYEILGGSPACRRCIDHAEMIMAKAAPGVPHRTAESPGTPAVAVSAP